MHTARSGTPVKLGRLLGLIALGALATVAEAQPAAPEPTQTAVAPASADPMGFVVPDSELVYGPTLYGFDTEAFVTERGGYLGTYLETVDGEPMYGPAVVQRVAEDYGVGPRVLLALVEASSGWVTQDNPRERTFPLAQPLPGLRDALALTADQLNAAYYGYRHDELRAIGLSDGTAVTLADTNAGTFAILAQTLKGATASTWSALEGPSRFAAAWTRLFGDAYQYQVLATLPEALPPVDLLLPFAAGEIWFFTAGPHAPWGIGAPRAAVSFAPPPAELSGCYPAGTPATAAAAGTVVRSRASGVVLDLDGDEFAGSGWAHVYVHTDDSLRAPVGARLRPGDVVGYPSCAGGLQTQTRISFARTYNGEWVPADYPAAPMVLGGWSVLAGPGTGEGWLARTGVPPRAAAAEKNAAQNGVTALPGG